MTRSHLRGQGVNVPGPDTAISMSRLLLLIIFTILRIFAALPVATVTCLLHAEACLLC